MEQRLIHDMTLRDANPGDPKYVMGGIYFRDRMREWIGETTQKLLAAKNPDELVDMDLVRKLSVAKHDAKQKRETP